MFDTATGSMEIEGEGAVAYVIGLDKSDDSIEETL